MPPPEPPRRERPDRGRLLPPLRRGQGPRGQEGNRGGRVGLQGQDAAGHGGAVRVRPAGESNLDWFIKRVARLNATKIHWRLPKKKRQFLFVICLTFKCLLDFKEEGH